MAMRKLCSITKATSMLITPAERGLSSRAVYKERRQASESDHEAARLIVADEEFGFARRWCKIGGKKIVATCVNEVTGANKNMIELKSNGATVIDGVNPAVLEPSEETKAFFAASKSMLRGFGAVQVLIEPKKIKEIKEMAVAAGLKHMRIEKFNARLFEDYKIPSDKDDSAPEEEEQKGKKKKNTITAGFKVLHFGSSTN